MTREEAEARADGLRGLRRRRASMLGSGGVIVMDDAQTWSTQIARAGALLRARELRPVHAVPRRHGVDDEDPGAHRRRARARTEDLDTLLDIADNMTGKTICVLSDSCAAPVVSGHPEVPRASSRRYITGPRDRSIAVVPGESLTALMADAQTGQPDDRGTAGHACRRARRSSRPPSRPACWSRTTATTRRCRSPASAGCASSRSRRRPSWRPRASTVGGRRAGGARPLARRRSKAREGRARAAAHQPPARLPDLRPGRRVRAAGLHVPGRPRRTRATASRSASIRSRISAATSCTSPNRCILCTRCVRFMEDVAQDPVLNVSRARRPRLHRQVRGAGPDAPLGRQRGRPLPGRLAALQGLPAQGARLGARPHGVGLPELHAGLQHDHRDARQRRSSGSGRGPTSTSTSTSCATTAG